MMREDRFWKFIELAYYYGLNNGSLEGMRDSISKRLRNIDILHKR